MQQNSDLIPRSGTQACKKRIANKGLPQVCCSNCCNISELHPKVGLQRARINLGLPTRPARNAFSFMSETFNTRYAALIAAKKIEADPGQAVLAKHLAALERRLDRHRLAQKSSALGWLFGNREKPEAPQKGLYVHGEVGRGKTMLM